MIPKFFNILDIRTFLDMSESEQKAILIKKNIYKKGISVKSDFILDDGEIWRGSINYPKYLGQDFEINGINYKLNDDFLDEVFNECIKYHKSHHIQLIENNVETLKQQAEFSGYDFIKEMRQKEIKNYNNYLPKKLFKKLHNSDFENEQQHFDILKSFLSINWFDLSDYLFGLNNISSYHIVQNYYKFIRLNRILDFLDSIKVDKSFFEEENDRSDIFNDDGEKIFKFIVSKYPQKQTKAFFSYLYFYLKNNKKIIPEGDDSLEYREYVINNYPINSFSKIQKTISEKTYTKKNKIFLLFDKYISEFNNSRKIEENLNKIE